MTELDQLIADFKITLSKFEAIASRMEARIAETDPVDPLADLPPLPPLPEGYSRWEYRGKGWKSGDPVKYAYRVDRFGPWLIQPITTTAGLEAVHYIEAVKTLPDTAAHYSASKSNNRLYPVRSHDLFTVF